MSTTPQQPPPPSPLSKSYDPTEVEPRWYAAWQSSGYFRARDTGDPRSAFSIMIPPPNVTGSLHMGHALFCTIQDTLTRLHRMRGENALWLPGTDHAGIATQVVVERLLQLEGTNRHALGREKFLERVWQWKAESGGRIIQQLKVLGASPDWERERFTMDPGLSRAVREAFVRLYEEGLIYRANRLVNWCVSCRTVISDLEVDREEGANGELFSFAYPFADGSGEIVVATTRPETILGDTAVAVHPGDERYKSVVGKQVKAPFHDRTIAVIADEMVDPAFGTGAVKITPAHDFNDFAAGKRHGLAEINILNPDGTLNAEAGRFAGFNGQREGRKAVKKALEEMGLARGGKPHRLALARCSRSNDVLEPIVSPQWYVKTKPLAEPVIAAVESGRTTFTPDEHRKVFMHWMTNIQDWCISRQLWWGHQIPVWNCGACGEPNVAREAPSQCAKCGAAGEQLTQDPDVLDTWFSSALWPISTLGWPDKTAALETFYPTSVMETGPDIIFFWVARMMMFGMHFMKDVPFRKVYLHAIVCDENGDKMSKVKANVIDPLDLVYGAPLETIVEHASMKGVPHEEGLKKFRKAYPAMSEMKEGFPAFGADAVRFYLSSNPPGADRIRLQLRQLERARNFANKIWNATRFALTYLEPLAASDAPVVPDPTARSLADRWVLSRLAVAIDEVNRGLDEFRLDEAALAARRFFWDELCDWYLELTKTVFAGSDERAKTSARHTLGVCLETAFRLLHPLIPFITEEVWQKLPASVRSRGRDGATAPHLIVAPFPTPLEGGAGAELPPAGAAARPARDVEAERAMELVQGVIVAVRNIRGELGIKPRDPVTVRLRTADPGVRGLLAEHEDAIRFLTLAREVVGEPSGGARPRGVGYATVQSVEVLVPLAGLIDPVTEAARLEREIAKAEKDLAKVDATLANKNFVDRAPPETVAQTRDEREAAAVKLARLRDALATIGEATSG